MTKKIYLGAAYYPEHWDESRWETDIHLMTEAGLNVVRMGEFAWAKMEPMDNEFHFEWLEKAIRALEQAGIKTVLGTPTAAPPAWLVKAHPEILLTEANGHKTFFGNRCHFCANSETYQRYTRRIAEQLATRFGKNPAVIGWQIDNEYNRVCYCLDCRKKFQAFLEQRYGTLDNLNARWTTHYWSQVYDRWDEIELPTDPWNPQSPGLRLEFQRFQTETFRRYQKIQLDALRPHLAEGVWVTHNFMDWFDAFDHYELAADLDLAAWDWYVSSGHNDYRTSGAKHDLVRGFKRGKGGSQTRPFWLMETQPATTSWGHIPNALHHGETRAMSWHAIAHGADAVLYWQWRSPLNGQEQYHGTLIDQSGQPRPFFADVAQLGKDFAAVGDLLAETTPRARVAMLNSYESRWSINIQRFHLDFDYVKHFNHYYLPFAAQNITVDLLPVSAVLINYKIIVAPALMIVAPELAARLTAFVRAGGHLVLTARTGMKDEFNALLPLRQPGPLADLAGAEVEEYYALDAPAPVSGNWFKGEARQWAERLRLRDDQTKIIARYGAFNGWLDDQPAITIRPVGRGFVYLVGAYLDDAAQFALLKHIADTAEVFPVLKTPPGVEAARRLTPDNKAITLLINHTRQPQAVTLPFTGKDHLSGQPVSDAITLAPYGVMVITR